MNRLKLTMALAHSDRHIPFLDGTVQPEGLDLTVLDVGQTSPSRYGANRHERMIRDGEFDVAAVSLSSYLMAKDQGLPLTAIPVFPRRLFSQPLIFCHADADIHTPKDLIGKKMGLNSFQTTLSVLAKGDLQEEYGVPWREIRWHTASEETLHFSRQDGISITRISEGKEIGEMVSRGELDIVATCTDSIVPVLTEPNWLEEGTHLTNLSVREFADEQIFNRCDVIVRLGDQTLASRESDAGFRPFHMAGYIAGQPEELARIPRAKVEINVERHPRLVEIVSGKAPGRTSPHQITCFINIGTQGLQFASVGGRVYHLARERGIGRELPTEWFIQDIRD